MEAEAFGGSDLAFVTAHNSALTASPSNTRNQKYVGGKASVGIKNPEN